MMIKLDCSESLVDKVKKSYSNSEIQAQSIFRS